MPDLHAGQLLHYCFSGLYLINMSSSHNLDMPCPDDKDPLNMDFTRYQNNTTHKQLIKQHNKPNHKEAHVNNKKTIW